MKYIKRITLTFLLSEAGYDDAKPALTKEDAAEAFTIEGKSKLESLNIEDIDMVVEE